MNKNKSKDVRSRDDTHLRKLVSETREWMKTEGIEEQALDWEAVAREEQALWWRERLRQALTELAERSREFADSVAERIRQLAAVAESQAEAALEVTLDAVQQVGRVLPEPAQACLRPDATLQFTHAPAAMRSRLGFGESQEESIGIFITSTIPGGRVIADARQHTLAVEFWEKLSAPLVMIVPEDPALASRIAEVSTVGGTTQARFESLQSGRYLLSIYSLGEDKP